MKAAKVYTVIVGVLAAVVVARGVPSGEGTDARLPGARPMIDAARFASLQAALNAVPPEGGIVRLPAGTFEIREPLVLARGDVLVEGAGTATHIKNLNTDGKPALIVQLAKGAKVKKTDRLWRVQLSNFRITGNKKSGHGIEAVQIEEIFIRGVTASYHGGDGIRLDRCYEDPRVSDNLITYNQGTGLNLIGCHDIVVAANQFEENQDAVRCIDSFNLCMTGNCVDDHLGHGVVIENTYGSVLSGNMIEECNGTAVILDRDCYGNTISANVIAHNGAGVDLRGAHGCSVSANTFTIMKAAALRIGPKSNRITVSGNNFSNSFIGDNTAPAAGQREQARIKRSKNDAAAAGLVLDGTSDIAIAGNVFSGVRPKAVSLEGNPTRRVVLDGNVLVDVESDHAGLKESVIGENLNGK